MSPLIVVAHGCFRADPALPVWYLRDPYVYQLPPECAREVVLTHPRCPKFAKLGLQWNAVPTHTTLGFSFGGVDYKCAPFSAWHMDLAVVKALQRYNVLQRAADALDIDATEPAWELRVHAELSVAVQHSWQQARVTMMSHESAATSFATHCQRERDAGRECPAQWSSIGGLVCHAGERRGWGMA